MGQLSIEGRSLHTLMDMVGSVYRLCYDVHMYNMYMYWTCTGHVKVQSAVTVCYVQSLLIVHEQCWRKLEPKGQQ